MAPRSHTTRLTFNADAAAIVIGEIFLATLTLAMVFFTTHGAVR